MKSLLLVLTGGLLLAANGAGAAPADTTVVLKGTHLCCAQCVRAVNQILQKIEGVTGKCDQEAETVTLSAKDNATIQKALDALATGGFHGTPDNKEFTIKDDSGATAGKVKTLTVTGVHNCCASCNRGINDALKKVNGVSANTAKARSDTFDVTGEFDAQDLVKALNAAGFHVKVKK